MTLLQTIQATAIDGAGDIETLLRQCRVLATRLQHEEFKHWVLCELDGYPDRADVPDYRVFRMQCFGNFQGPFGSGARNASIPTVCIPSECRDALTSVRMRDGVASLKRRIEECDDGNIRYFWPGETMLAFGGEIYQNMQLSQGWGVIPVSCVVGSLSTVRNRILSFALEIEASNPGAGEPESSSPPVPKEAVTQIFNTYVLMPHSTLVQMNVDRGDDEGLARFLRDKGMDESEIQLLRDAIEEDRKEGDSAPAKPGRNVSNWLKRAADGALKIGSNVAGSVISDAIKKYYGM